MNYKKKLGIKLVLIGDSSAGKTSIVNRYIDNNFSDDIEETKIPEKNIKIIEYEDYIINLIIYDTSGIERYIIGSLECTRGADGIIFVFDVTSEQSFNTMINYKSFAYEYNQNYIGIICVNKIDLVKDDKWTPDVFSKYGIDNKINIFRTSAKNGININEAFNKLIELIMEKKTKNLIDNDNGLSRFNKLNKYLNF